MSFTGATNGQADFEKEYAQNVVQTIQSEYEALFSKYVKSAAESKYYQKEAAKAASINKDVKEDSSKVTELTKTYEAKVAKLKADHDSVKVTLKNEIKSLTASLEAEKKSVADKTSSLTKQVESYVAEIKQLRANLDESDVERQALKKECEVAEKTKIDFENQMLDKIRIKQKELDALKDSKAYKKTTKKASKKASKKAVIND